MNWIRTAWIAILTISMFSCQRHVSRAFLMLEPLKGHVKEMDEWRYDARRVDGIWIQDTLGYLGHFTNAFHRNGRLGTFTQFNDTHVVEIWIMEYDSAGRLVHQYPKSNPECERISSDTHNALGLPTVVTTNQCDSIHPDGLAYDWNQDGTMKSYSTIIIGANNFYWSYAYDSLGRLTREDQHYVFPDTSEPQSTRSYSYKSSDKKGNWTERLMVIEEANRAEIHVRRFRYRWF